MSRRRSPSRSGAAADRNDARKRSSDGLVVASVRVPAGDPVSPVPVLPTGISTLDLILRGGIPARQTVVVTGEPGTGKAILGSQVAFTHAKAGRRVVLATVASESHDLYIAAALARLHGGVIEVESELGQGSAFKVVLPLDV